MKYTYHIIFLTLALAALLLPPAQKKALAYSIETHAYLTSEAVDFYNANVSERRIADEFKSYLIEGARREDDTIRPLNHFYDPVYDRGLTYDPAIDPLNVGTWMKSKDWAEDEIAQSGFKYRLPTAVASVLNALQIWNLSAISDETNFTWRQALRYWTKGEKEKAFFALGHILHLIEDASVPDHTRNDPHPGDSPYEAWTKQFTLGTPDADLKARLSGKSPIHLEVLGDYFNELAKYSNNNFYSKDTIGIQSGYQLPQPEIFPKKINNLYFAFKNDDKEHLLFLVEKYKDGNNLLILPRAYASLNDPFDIVLTDYWSRLSTKAVQYSAGVINLFFEEAEKASMDPSSLGETPKSFFAQLVGTVGNFLATVADSLNGIVARIVGVFSHDADLSAIATFENLGEIKESASAMVEQIEGVPALSPGEAERIIASIQKEINSLSQKINALSPAAQENPNAREVVALVGQVQSVLGSASSYSGGSGVFTSAVSENTEEEATNEEIVNGNENLADGGSSIVSEEEQGVGDDEIVNEEEVGGGDEENGEEVTSTSDGESAGNEEGLPAPLRVVLAQPNRDFAERGTYFAYDADGINGNISGLKFIARKLDPGDEVTVDAFLIYFRSSRRCVGSQCPSQASGYPSPLTYTISIGSADLGDAFQEIILTTDPFSTEVPGFGFPVLAVWAQNGKEFEYASADMPRSSCYYWDPNWQYTQYWCGGAGEKKDAYFELFEG